MKKITIILITLIAGQLTAQLIHSNTGAQIHINGGASLYLDGNIVNHGALNLKNESSMIVKGNIDNHGRLSNDGYIDIYGNIWSATKIDNPDFGTWNFIGTTQQGINSDSALIAKNFYFNNPAGFVADVKYDLKVTGTAHFVNGILQTLASTRLKFGSTASHTTASNVSHVHGLVAKEGIGNFIYPIGTGTNLQSVAINAMSNPTAIQVGYSAFDAGSALFGISGAVSTPLQAYNTAEFWQVSSGGAQGTIELTHDTHNALIFSNLADLRVAKKDGSEWQNQGGNAVGSNSNATISSLNNNLDGSFTLGVVKKDIQIALQNPSGKTSICKNDTLTIHVRRLLGINEYPTSTTYSISPSNAAIKINDTTFSLIPSSTTLFTVTGTDQNNLMGIVNFNLVVNQLPNVTAAIQNPIIVNGSPLNIWPQNQAVVLAASGASSYSWSPSTYVVGPTSLTSLVATPSNHITYHVTGIDGNGCKNTTSVNVRVFSVVNTSQTSCNSILWRGKTISNTGFYGDTISASFVDTIFGLNFTSNAVNTGIVFENGKLASQCMNCTYQWYSCRPDGSKVIIENAKSRVLNITTSGSYSVEVSNGLCTSSSSCISNTSSSIASLDEFKGISVFPNPFVENLQVLLDEKPINALIQIVDINGRVVHSKQVVKASETTLNLSTLSQGTYYIQIYFEKQKSKMYYTKIVKE